MTRSPKHGFTLIELLVVISIVALLISILLPALGKARKSAARVQCQARLHNLMIATLAFATDNNDKVPNRGKPAYPHATSANTASIYFVDANPSDTYPLNVWQKNYMQASRGDSLFCPGELMNDPTRRPEAAGYSTEWMTYQYYGDADIQNRWGWGTWRTSRPLLDPNDVHASPRTPMWSCITARYKATGLWLAHDSNSSTKTEGQNAAQLDGSVKWVGLENLEWVVYSGSLEFYRWNMQ
jgi:prepilin-type N-terminal cleavage/methylation domain-containing protein